MLNKAVLMGRLTADPELRKTPNGTSVTSFSIAVNRPRFNKESADVADFIDCVAWRTTAEFISKWFQKGQMIAITGRIQTRTWTDKQDQKRKNVEISVDEAFFADSKREGGGSQQRSTGGGNTVDPMTFDLGPSENEFASMDMDDSDLPF